MAANAPHGAFHRLRLCSPAVLAGFQVSTGGPIWVSTEDIEHLRSEMAFARLCAAAPIAGSSGKTVRHRLNPHGNREANRALHKAVVVRMRYCTTTQAYVQLRVEECRSRWKAMRCQKRFRARALFRSRCTDLKALPRGLPEGRAACLYRNVPDRFNPSSRDLLFRIRGQVVDDRLAEVKGHGAIPFDSPGHGLQQRIAGVGVELDVDLGRHVIRQVDQLTPTCNRH